jgi:adenylate kinase
MNILVCGVHGSGKTSHCAKYSATRPWVHRSASELIREELGLQNWTLNKEVSDVAGNQRALITAVRRENLKGTRLLLDGHFVLLEPTAEMILIDEKVFAQLSLCGVLLLEVSAAKILLRLSRRDGYQSQLKQTITLQDAERAHAANVCASLGIPLIVLREPSANGFFRALDTIAKNATNSQHCCTNSGPRRQDAHEGCVHKLENSSKVKRTDFL